MADYISLLPNKIPKFGEVSSAAIDYWNSFQHTVHFSEPGSVNHVEFSPQGSSFVVSNTFRLHIYDYSTSQVLKRVSKFPSHVYAASYRNDGRLLAVGSEDSIVRIVQVAAVSGTSTILRQLPHKSAAVHAARFLGDNLRIASACDDGYVRLWDLATGSILSSAHSHTDYVRALCPSARDVDLFASGSYDNTARIWDTRVRDGSSSTNSSSIGQIFSVNHGAPVESLLFLPSESILVTAGGTCLKFWSVTGGSGQGDRGKLIAVCRAHHKTITTLALTRQGHRRLVSGALDRHVKIYDLATYRPIYQFRHAKPVLSVSAAEDDGLVVGMQEGLLCIRKRQTTQSSRAADCDELLVSASTATVGGELVGRVNRAFYTKPTRTDPHLEELFAMHAAAAVDTSKPMSAQKPQEPEPERLSARAEQLVDVVVVHRRKRRLKFYDRMLKLFEHSRCLRSVFLFHYRQLRDEHSDLLFEILQELIRRDVLRNALLAVTVPPVSSLALGESALHEASSAEAESEAARSRSRYYTARETQTAREANRLLLNVLSFAGASLGDARHQPTLVVLLDTLLELALSGPLCDLLASSRSRALVNSFKHLRARLGHQLHVTCQIAELCGVIESIVEQATDYSD